MIKFQVVTGPALSHNALLSGMPIARQKQTADQHRALLDIKTVPGYRKYLTLRRTNPALADIMKRGLVIQAIEREKKDPRYWDNDKFPRRPVKSSSSWIGTVNYDPNTRNMMVRIGNKFYTVPGQHSLQVKAFLESPSLGRYFNQHYKHR